MFESKDQFKSTTTHYRINCIGCHIPAEPTDWVYVQGYPALNKKE